MSENLQILNEDMKLLNSDAGIIFNDTLYGYEELCTYVKRVKRIVHDSCLEDGLPVAILLQRSPWIICAMIALLEMKIPYVLIDDKLPKERILYMMENSKVGLVLTDEFREDFPVRSVSLRSQNRKEESEVRCYESELAYIMFTSGTTGLPKAVEVTREGVLNFIEAIPERIPFHRNKRFACLTNCMFDIFFVETILALKSGMTVVLANETECVNPREIKKLIEKHHISHVQMTPSRMLMLQMADNNFSCLSKVEYIMLGGEMFPKKLLTSLQEMTSAKIYNMYGPVETTIWSTLSDLTDSACINIGFPIKNTIVKIVDENLKVKSQNEKGYIYIGGKGVARGYRGDVEQTEERFVNINGERMYNTGDIGCLNDDGTLSCFGRNDSQVKIRGYRVELEEVDFVLSKLLGNTRVVSYYLESEGLGKLVLFYTTDEKLEREGLYDKFREHLPDYMIPEKFIRVPEILYTSSGKINRRKMAELYLQPQDTDVGYESINKASGLLSVEQRVLRIVADVLEVPLGELSREQQISSFVLDSIKYVSLIVCFEEAFGFEFEEEYLIKDAFETWEGLIEYIANRGNILMHE